MVKDSWPVIAEDFSQWVVEDNFCDGMPAWDKVSRASTYNRTFVRTIYIFAFLCYYGSFGWLC